MTRPVYHEDAYLRDRTARVTALTHEGGIVLDATIFYPTGGGQPGDSGWIVWDGNRLPIATALRGPGEDVILVPSEPAELPPLGAHVTQVLDWDRRHRHMRVHTALHLLSVALPFPVIGGQIGSGHGRLDFEMPEALPDREEVHDLLKSYVARDLCVRARWITQDDLDAEPDLVKTARVCPPRGAQAIRLVCIGEDDDPLDRQACGGTHVARTGEIGALRLGKMENKGRHSRRIYLHLDS